MKYLHFFFLITLFSNLFAQNGININTKICKNKFTKSTSFLKVKGKRRILQNEITFDSAGNTIKETNYSFENIYETISSYNKNNLLLNEITYKLIGNKIKDSESIYKYDSINNLTETISYYYDSLNNITSEYRYINFYTNSKITKQIWQRPLDTLIDSYVYDKADSNKVNIYQIQNEKTYGRAEQIFKGKLLIKSTYYSPNDNSYTATEYIYNNKNNLISVINYPEVLTLEENADKLKNHTKHRVFYNKSGLEKKWVCYIKGGKKLIWKRLTFYK